MKHSRALNSADNQCRRNLGPSRTPTNVTIPSAADNHNCLHIMKHENELLDAMKDSTQGLPTIPEYYSGKVIFMTGGTGFMGKVLIEKLLWSCPDIKGIYLLLRPKKGKDGRERLVDLEKSKLFERLRIRDPNLFLNKVNVINGDINEIGLGLAKEDRDFLINNVNIVVHAAASVRFDDSLKVAVIMNTRGTREMMLLSREMKNINVFLHVSTVYCNTDKNPVEEILYPPIADWKTTIDIAETVDDNTLRILTLKYLDKLPNTYVFSKNLAEHVVNDLKGDIPVIIFRPSIVVSSLEEPMPGWIENFNGPVGLLVACGKGIMRSMYPGADTRADYMAVDIAIKAMIIAIWKSGNIEKKGNDIPVYNSCSSMAQNITYDDIIKMGMTLVHRLPLNDIVWIPGGGFTKYKILHYIRIVLLHLLPAIFIDILLKINGHKPMLVKVQRRIYIASQALHYYIANEWKFKNEHYLSLKTVLLPEDQKWFDYDFDNINIFEFFENALMGAKRYLLNEPDETIPQARLHYRRMWVLDKIVKILFWVLIIWYLYSSTFIRYCATETLHQIGIM